MVPQPHEAPLAPVAPRDPPRKESERRLGSGHASGVRALAEVAGVIFSGDENGSIHRNGDAVQPGMRHADRVSGLACLLDILISASWDGTLQVWEVSGACRQTLEGHSKGVAALALDPRKLWVYSGDFAGVVFAWKPDRSAVFSQALRFQAHDKVSALCCDEAGRLVTAGHDMLVKLWEDGVCTRVISAGGTPVVSLSIPNCGRVFCLLSDGSLRVLAPGCYTPMELATSWCRYLETREARVLAISGDAVGFVGDGTHELFAHHPDEPLFFEPISGAVMRISSVLLRSGTELVVGGLDGTIAVWHLQGVDGPHD